MWGSTVTSTSPDVDIRLLLLYSTCGNCQLVCWWTCQAGDGPLCPVCPVVKQRDDPPPVPLPTTQWTTKQTTGSRSWRASSSSSSSRGKRPLARITSCDGGPTMGSPTPDGHQPEPRRDRGMEQPANGWTATTTRGRARAWQRERAGSQSKKSWRIAGRVVRWQRPAQSKPSFKLKLDLIAVIAVGMRARAPSYM